MKKDWIKKVSLNAILVSLLPKGVSYETKNYIDIGISIFNDTIS